jgi:hypothetical protein
VTLIASQNPSAPSSQAPLRPRKTSFFAAVMMCASFFTASSASAWERAEFGEQKRATGVALGSDRIGVWVCQIPEGTETPDPGEVSAWSNASVTPWFDNLSAGRYRPTFESLGTFQAPAGSTTNDCLRIAKEMTPSPYSNTMAVTNLSPHSGVGGPGGASNLAVSPSTSGRGFAVGGRVSLDNNAWLVIHELGHTLHWPHYFTGPSSEYDSTLDPMSSIHRTRCDGCVAAHTVAINRYLNGWIDESEVSEQTTSDASYSVQPHGSLGTKLVLVPTATTGRYLTIEARVSSGNDRLLLKHGALVSLIDTRASACASTAPCLSVRRRQGPAIGVPGSYDSVLQPGESLSVDGVTVRNAGTSGPGYSVEVTGARLAPTRPLEVTSQFAGYARATVSWRAPSNAGTGSPVIFKVTSSDTGMELCSTTNLFCEVAATPDTYNTFQVVATSDVGSGMPVATSYEAPASRTSVTTVGFGLSVKRGDRSLSVSWKEIPLVAQYVLQSGKGQELCRTTTTSCMVFRVSPWEKHDVVLLGTIADTGQRTFIASKYGARSYRRVSKSNFATSSLVSKSLRANSWKAGPGCKITRGRVSMTRPKCSLSFKTGRTLRTLELRR